LKSNGHKKIHYQPSVIELLQLFCQGILVAEEGLEPPTRGL